MIAPRRRRFRALTRCPLCRSAGCGFCHGFGFVYRPRVAKL